MKKYQLLFLGDLGLLFVGLLTYAHCSKNTILFFALLRTMFPLTLLKIGISISLVAGGISIFTAKKRHAEETFFSFASYFAGICTIGANAIAAKYNWTLIAYAFINTIGAVVSTLFFSWYLQARNNRLQIIRERSFNLFGLNTISSIILVATFVMLLVIPTNGHSQEKNTIDLTKVNCLAIITLAQTDSLLQVIMHRSGLRVDTTYGPDKSAHCFKCMDVIVYQKTKKGEEIIIGIERGDIGTWLQTKEKYLWIPFKVDWIR